MRKWCCIVICTNSYRTIVSRSPGAQPQLDTCVVGHCRATCPTDFQQYCFFIITSETHKVYNSQLYLVPPHSLSL